MKKIITLCVLSILLAGACKKNNTPGPQGPQGNAGPQGAGHNDTVVSVTHDTISDLPDTARTGGIQVIYSDWFTPGTWTPTGTGNGSGGTGGTGGSGSGGGQTIPNLNQFYFFNEGAPKITQAILDKGMVLAYCKFANEPTNTRPLPANTVNTGIAQVWNFILSLGNIQFTMYSFAPVTSGFDSGSRFRYVIIPPTTHLRLKKPLNEMSYDEVCSLFNIPK